MSVNKCCCSYRYVCRYRYIIDTSRMFATPNPCIFILAPFHSTHSQCETTRRVPWVRRSRAPRVVRLVGLGIHALADHLGIGDQTAHTVGITAWPISSTQLGEPTRISLGECNTQRKALKGTNIIFFTTVSPALTPFPSSLVIFLRFLRPSATHARPSRRCRFGTAPRVAHGRCRSRARRPNRRPRPRCRQRGRGSDGFEGFWRVLLLFLVKNIHKCMCSYFYMKSFNDLSWFIANE